MNYYWPERRGATLDAEGTVPQDQLDFSSLATTITTLAAAGQLFIHDPSSNPNYNGFKFGFGYSTHPLSGSGIGGEDYVNAVWGWGINWGPAGNGARLDPSKAAIGWVFESKYYAGGTSYSSEAHLNFWQEDGSSKRIMSWAGPHSGPSGGALSFKSDGYTIFDWADSLHIQVSLPNHFMKFFNGLYLQADDNNYQFIRQMNAAGTGPKTLLYLDSIDRANILAPLRITDVRSSDGRFLRIAPTSANANDYAISVDVPTSAGPFFGLRAEGSVADRLAIDVRNNNNASASALAEFVAVSGGANGGDAQLRLAIIGGSNFTLGIDNSDSDAFVVSAASSLGSSNRLRIDANKVDLLLPPKVPSYTVAGAPSASTPGAGSLIYVSDETGGATLAFSDGSDWRRVTDRAVVS